jgi:hypothetical protein
MTPLMSFFGPFVATWALTMASLALVVVVRSDRAEVDRRGLLSQLASLLGWITAAAMPLFGALWIFDLAESAAQDGHGYALLGIIGGTALGFRLLGRPALFPGSNDESK